nr:DUF998 domain-containing protein [Kutzneria buriramensis]
MDAVAVGTSLLFRSCSCRPTRPSRWSCLRIWVCCLTCMDVVFGTHRIDPTMDAAGMAHRTASIVAFVCLPLAVLASVRRAFPYAPRRRLTARLPEPGQHGPGIDTGPEQGDIAHCGSFVIVAVPRPNTHRHDDAVP